VREVIFEDPPGLSVDSLDVTLLGREMIDSLTEVPEHGMRLERGSESSGMLLLLVKNSRGDRRTEGGESNRGEEVVRSKNPSGSGQFRRRGFGPATRHGEEERRRDGRGGKRWSRVGRREGRKEKREMKRKS